MREPCPFCGSAKNAESKEHWLPKSWGGYFDLVPMLVDGVAVEGEVVQGSVRINNRSQFDIQFGGICARCNNGWMHDIDEAAEQAIISLGTRQSSVIPTAEVLPVAASLYRAALMGIWGNRHRHGAPLQRFAEFYSTHLPPQRGVSIWVADAELPFDMAGGWHSRLTIKDDDNNEEDTTATWFEAWGGVGWLWVLVMVGQVGMEPALHPLERRITERAQGRLKRIWPHPRRERVTLGPPLPHDIAELLAQPKALLTGENRRKWEQYVPDGFEKRIEKHGPSFSGLLRPRTKDWPS